MKKVNCIRIFFILSVVLVIGIFRLLSFQKEKEETEPIATEQGIAEEIIEETEIAAPVSNNLDYKYIIVEEGDYLTVYFSDGVTVYEYTGIRYSDLEDSLRQKIRKGYCIKDEEVLYGFLENYSS